MGEDREVCCASSFLDVFGMISLRYECNKADNSIMILFYDLTAFGGELPPLAHFFIIIMKQRIIVKFSSGAIAEST